LELRSVGVYSVDVAEVADVGLRAVDDSQVSDGRERPPGHAYVDYKSVLNSNQQKKRAAKLRDAAQKRGWEYQPPSASA
jgi:hypothetical protein